MFFKVPANRTVKVEGVDYHVDSNNAVRRECDHGKVFGNATQCRCECDAGYAKMLQCSYY
jgi:hypothetical protein